MSEVGQSQTRMALSHGPGQTADQWPDNNEDTLIALTRAPSTTADQHSDKGDNTTTYHVVLATSIPELRESYYQACQAVWGVGHPQEVSTGGH